MLKKKNKYKVNHGNMKSTNNTENTQKKKMKYSNFINILNKNTIMCKGDKKTKNKHKKAEHKLT